jgi:hypothetical protein
MAQKTYEAEGAIEAIINETRGKYEITQVVLEVDGYEERKEFVSFEFFAKKAEKVKGFQEGDRVEISFNLAGRKAASGKYYSSNSAWQIKSLGSSQPHQRGSSVNNERRPAQKDYPLKDRRDTVPDWNDQSEAPF